MSRLLKIAIASGVGAVVAAMLPLAGQPAVAAEQPTNLHHVAVVKLVGRGDYPAGTTDASMLHRVDLMLDFWEAEGGDALAFVRPTEVHALQSAESCNDSTEMRKQAKALFPSMTFGGASGDHLILIMPSSCRTSSPVGSLGSAGLRSGGYIVGGYSEDNDEVSSLAHEMGHNLGLDHAQGMTCAEADCALYEYGDRYSTMGVTVSGAGYTPRALSSFERVRLGLAGDAEVEPLALEPGRRVRSFDVALRGRATDSGLRGVRLTDPVDASTYYLDFRNGLGRDSGAYLNKAGAHAGSYFYNKGVTVQKIATDASGSPFSVLQAFDWPPTAGWHYALISGESFTTASGGVRVQVDGEQFTGSTEDVATLHVTLTDPSAPLGTQHGSIAISEQGAVGSTVSAASSGWEDAALGPVQWFDDDVAIDGATGPTYTIPDSMDGHSLTARITGTREGYEDQTATSNTLVVGQDLLTSRTTYQVASVASGALIDSAGPRDHRGNVQAHLVAPPVSAFSRWTAIQVSAGVYQLRNPATGKCLDDERSRATAENPIIVWSCTSGANQQWRLVGSGSGYALVNRSSGLTLTPEADGLLVQASGAYAWTFAPVP